MASRVDELDLADTEQLCQVLQHAGLEDAQQLSTNVAVVQIYTKLKEHIPSLCASLCHLSKFVTGPIVLPSNSPSLVTLYLYLRMLPSVYETSTANLRATVAETSVIPGLLQLYQRVALESPKGFVEFMDALGHELASVAGRNWDVSFPYEVVEGEPLRYTKLQGILTTLGAIEIQRNTLSTAIAEFYPVLRPLYNLGPLRERSMWIVHDFVVSVLQKHGIHIGELGDLVGSSKYQEVCSVSQNLRAGDVVTDSTYRMVVQLVATVGNVHTMVKELQAEQLRQENVLLDLHTSVQGVVQHSGVSEQLTQAITDVVELCNREICNTIDTYQKEIKELAVSVSTNTEHVKELLMDVTSNVEGKQLMSHPAMQHLLSFSDPANPHNPLEYLNSDACTVTIPRKTLAFNQYEEICARWELQTFDSLGGVMDILHIAADFVSTAVGYIEGVALAVFDLVDSVKEMIGESHPELAKLIGDVWEPIEKVGRSMIEVHQSVRNLLTGPDNVEVHSRISSITIDVRQMVKGTLKITQTLQHPRVDTSARSKFRERESQVSACNRKWEEVARDASFLN